MLWYENTFLDCTELTESFLMTNKDGKNTIINPKWNFMKLLTWFKSPDAHIRYKSKSILKPQLIVKEPATPATAVFNNHSSIYIINMAHPM